MPNSVQITSITKNQKIRPTPIAGAPDMLRAARATQAACRWRCAAFAAPCGRLKRRHHHASIGIDSDQPHERADQAREQSDDRAVADVIGSG